MIPEMKLNKSTHCVMDIIHVRPFIIDHPPFAFFTAATSIKCHPMLSFFVPLMEPLPFSFE